MQWRQRACGPGLVVALLVGIALPCAGCGVSSAAAPASKSSAAAQAPAAATALTGANPLTGDVTPVRDPAIAREGKLLYVVSTDDADLNLADGYLPIHCSQDGVKWQSCGHVFSSLPAWIGALVPGVGGLWAPDLSYFNGEWHLYYAASTLFGQVSAIGLATSPTLDQSSPDYRWTDRGPVVTSHAGDNFNALDPNVVFDGSNQPWLNYGSFWSGIRQQQLDPKTGLTDGSALYSLAASPRTQDHAIEAATMLQHAGYYYLFASTGHCCETDLSQDDYNIIVGRSSSPHGPFVDEHGTNMMQGGGTVVLSGGTQWIAPGSADAWTDPSTGDSVMVFHALDLKNQGHATLWMLPLTWTNGWPQLQQPAP